ncbi:hypothetical protein CRG98_008703 [Punica granatum]|uniref:Uncharacterized protein n=1 Tax=Punica granatum TaxID=22663 RepID=A0A2I0KQY6_PUNGR|nr:hypothetical protein CRG98_008703 [Punica granatum]
MAVSGKRLSFPAFSALDGAVLGLNDQGWLLEFERVLEVLLEGELLGAWSHRILGFSRGLEIEPWLGVEPWLGGLAWLSYLECSNEEDWNEPHIAIRRVNECSGDSAPRESVLPCSDIRSGVERPRPVLGCRLLVSGSGLGSPVRKGVRERSGVSRLTRDAPGTRPDVSLVILALRGIFRVPYWTPFGVSVIR